MQHDYWSQLGMNNIGEMNKEWAERGSWDMLIKAIINDYWADDPKQEGWSKEKVDIVMSKLYYCWVRRVFSPEFELEKHSYGFGIELRFEEVEPISGWIAGRSGGEEE